MHVKKERVEIIMNNFYFFKDKNDEYRNNILNIQAGREGLFNTIFDLINTNLNEGDTVLDIGNGGIIRCNYKKLHRLICADLFINENVANKYLYIENVSFETANILDLNKFEDNSFDTVIACGVLHHIAGKSKNKTKENVITALLECNRKIKPNGKILIVEDMVYKWFEMFEIIFYPIIQTICKTLGFGYIYQYSLQSFSRLLEYCKLKTDIIPIRPGEYGWFMNLKIPIVLMPSRPFFFIVRKK